MVEQRNLQQEVEQLRQDNMAIRALLTNRTSTDTDAKLNRDCKDIYLNGQTQSGVYKINPLDNEILVDVYCDMVTEGGGWTAIQKRRSGSVRFNRTWAEYRNGFGNPKDSYWIGNDVIHKLTKGINPSLYVSITLQNDTNLYEIYNKFSISDEASLYLLFLGGPAIGTLGDSMLYTNYFRAVLSGMSFSTPDRDNDRWSGSCAATWRGGWWFNHCHYAFLNGPWYPEDWTFVWHPTLYDNSNVKDTLMMIKRH
ncbi:fibrinogen-like protein 1 [Saccostrea echinata]|uniref:fibrinogen-like protein 1 n=1 Tax=Saccostrea echinata TaxID=191078 RepID=UPI002A7F46A8|nr:fibrinogen-like protein 1 [Saccostrea echinata]